MYFPNLSDGIFSLFWPNYVASKIFLVLIGDMGKRQVYWDISEFKKKFVKNCIIPHVVCNLLIENVKNAEIDDLILFRTK